jgi:hypothetical protein
MCGLILYVWRWIKLFKRTLLLCITIALFLSGCGARNENTEINEGNKQEIISNNKQEKVIDDEKKINSENKQNTTSEDKDMTNASKDKKLTEIPTSDSKSKTVTSLDLSDLALKLYHGHGCIHQEIVQHYYQNIKVMVLEILQKRLYILRLMKGMKMDILQAF